MNKYLVEIMDSKANEYRFTADVFMNENQIRYTVDENNAINMITIGNM